jgi:hypothetical protein
MRVEPGLSEAALMVTKRELPGKDASMLRCHMIAYSVAVLLLTYSAAEARIVCDGDFQVVNGREIYTPYCGDNKVAATARKDGMKVTNGEVRGDPATKSDICQWLRSDKSLNPECN